MPLEAQFWSNGTSGHFAALALVSLAGAQSKFASGRQRSAVVKRTCAVGLTVSASVSFEPYVVLARLPPRVYEVRVPVGVASETPRL